MKPNLHTECHANWPKLAWVAHCKGDTITLHHGRFVEITDQWAFEGVWAGDYEAGDFDQQEVVFGTGVRLRDDRVFFVSQAHSLDKLFHLQMGDEVFVANTLPGLAAKAKVEWDYGFNYAQAITTIHTKNQEPIQQLPTANGADIHITFYDNLVYDGQTIQKIDKPLLIPPIKCFDDFHQYMCKSIDAMGVNLNNPKRQHMIEPWLTMSSGYDSNAVAIYATRMGCRKGWTRVESRGVYFKGDDSGKKVAKLLGVDLEEIVEGDVCDEHLVWSAIGKAGAFPYTSYKFPEDRVRLLFTGNHGGILWAGENHNQEFLFRSSTAGTGFTEFRLHRGFVQCPLPFIGVKRGLEIQNITSRKEMDPWRLNRKRYDRPIPRRIVEEAGVPRELFGQTKFASGAPWVVFWPRDPQNKKDLKQFLLDHNFPIVMTWGPLQRWVDQFKTTTHCLCKYIFKFSPFQNNYYNLPQNGQWLWSINKIAAENYKEE